MKKITLHIVCALCLLMTFAQSGDIHRLQYYFDSDPGFGVVGNGAVIDLAAPTIDLNQSFNWTLPPELDKGIHHLFVRVQDDDHSWSLADRSAIFIMQVNMSQVSGLEYFIDDDPGVGNGIGIPINPSPTDAVSESIAITLPTDISSGIHHLLIRAKSDGMAWSLIERTAFYLPPADALNSVSELEYYIDDDPGVGNGISIPISPTPTAALSETIAIALPTDISSGIHHLLIRAKSDAMAWSLIDQAAFYVPPADELNDVSELEYYIDVDPGVGNGTAIALDATVSALNQTFNLTPPTELSNGIHHLFVRARHSSSNWSLIDAQAFYQSPALSSSDLVAMEYFYDNDPGIGAAITIEIEPAQSIDMTYMLPVPCIEAGEHNLFVRVLDSNGDWSLLHSDNWFSDDGVISDVIVAAGPTSLCDGESVTLSVTQVEGFGYQWLMDGIDIPGETGVNLLVTEAGEYAVRSECVPASALSDVVVVTSGSSANCADINADGIVDVQDFIAFNSAYGTTCDCCPEDINGDGIVNVLDFIELNSQYGGSCDPLAPPLINADGTIILHEDLRKLPRDNFSTELLKDIEEPSTDLTFFKAHNPSDGLAIRLIPMLSFQQEMEIDLVLIDLSGRTTQRLTAHFGRRDTEFVIVPETPLSRGLYLLKVTDASGTVNQVLRLLVE